MLLDDIPGAVSLQRACFPAPFPEELLWQPEHVQRHLEFFPEGQFVAVDNDRVIGSASSCLISEENWKAHRSWEETVGGHFIDNHDPQGSTMYGLDVSVHPAHREKGIGKELYRARFRAVRELALIRYGTACRLPDYRRWAEEKNNLPVETYVKEVVEGQTTDRTLTPLLRYGLTFLGVLHGYMDDEESANSAALLEWKP